jgi:hypothetical protein
VSVATAYSVTYPYLRVILGDTEIAYQRWTDAVLEDAVEAALLTNDTYSASGSGIDPTVASDNDLALIIYEAAKILINPTPGAHSYRTRGLSVSRDGAHKRDLLAFLEEKVRLIKEDGDDVFTKDSSLLAFLEDARRSTDTISEAITS